MTDDADLPAPDVMAELSWTDFMNKVEGAIGDGPEAQRLIDAMGAIRRPLNDDDVWVALLDGMRETLEKMRP